MQAKTYVAILTALLDIALQPAFADSTTTNQNNFLESLNPRNATIIVQAGGFNATQGGGTQDIGINGLLGDQFTVNQTHGSNFLVGLGYYLNGLTTSKVQWLYGINAGLTH